MINILDSADEIMSYVELHEFYMHDGEVSQVLESAKYLNINSNENNNKIYEAILSHKATDRFYNYVYTVRQKLAAENFSKNNQNKFFKNKHQAPGKKQKIKRSYSMKTRGEKFDTVTLVKNKFHNLKIEIFYIISKLIRVLTLFSLYILQFYREVCDGFKTWV